MLLLPDSCMTELQGDQEKNETKLVLLEERVAVLKVQNIELKNYFNSVIQLLNKVLDILPPIDTPPQHTYRWRCWSKKKKKVVHYW